eukprot:TRINITY_DN343_c0_g5_i1.p1 TRINITY_DN343_c0_g5~~TRINITY_DN343_c0_g5_i1.p1  ORF type:complete len:474 (-),score=149.64 TRINITY_DN343_c0_g5_i1:545-1966(-)
MAHRVHKDELIHKRQQQESARNVFVQETYRHHTLKQQAQWENRTHAKIEHNAVENTFRAFKQMQLDNLEARRQRLADLLQQDELMYAQELEMSKETTEQRVARMEERALELRTHRKEETKKFAEEQLTRKWREECDDLRAVKSKAMLMATVSQRSNQVEEKKLKKEADKAEQQFYDEQWEADRLKKIQREEQEKARAAQLNETTRLELDGQVKLIAQRREEERLLGLEEARLLKEKQKLEEEEAARTTLMQQERDRQLRITLQKENMEKVRERKEKERLEREQDAKALEEMLQDEKYRGLHSMEKKSKWREEITAYMNYLAEMRRQEQEMEREVDRMRHEMMEEQYARTEAKWRQEKEARDRLMGEVYTMRKQQIQEKIDSTRGALETKIRERILMEQEVKRIKEKEDEIESSRKTARFTNRQYLEEQMQVKEWEKKMDKYSRTQEYQRRLEDDQAYTVRSSTEKKKKKNVAS